MEAQNTLITEEFLLKNDFNRYEKYNGDLIEFVSEDGLITFIKYSNTIGRDWHIRVENDDYETIGNLDISNLDQVKKFLELCDYEFEWKC